MERVIRQLTQELGEPFTAETAGHEFYHWRATFGEVEIFLYLTVLADGGKRTAFAAVICEAHPNGIVTMEVRGPEDFGKVAAAIQHCTRKGRMGD